MAFRRTERSYAAANDGEVVGRYRLLRRIGRGGTAEVFLAEDIARGARVAIKRLSDPASGRGAWLAHEARIAGRLDHRAIVRVLDFVSDGAVDHIVMELVDGPSLRELCARGPMAIGDVLRVARELVLGLDHAHGHGVVHRDIKAENVLLAGDGQPKISDFGIAASLSFAAAETLDPRDALGTSRTMSPEQIRGDAVDARSDLFSLGVMLYELLTGTSPFAADSDAVTRLRVLCDEPPRVRDLIAGIAPAVCDVISHLLEKAPAARPQTARDVLARLPAAGAR